jgi:outer membrane protein assembly factor BamB
VIGLSPTFFKRAGVGNWSGYAGMGGMQIASVTAWVSIVSKFPCESGIILQTPLNECISGRLLNQAHSMKFLQPLPFSFAALFAICFTAFAEALAPLPDIPEPVTSFGAAVSDGSLYVYGGNTGKAHEFHRDCVRGDFFRLKISGGAAWEKLPGGEGLLSCSLVSWQGGVIRIGGMTARNTKGEKNDLRSTDEVLRFDPSKNAWKPLTPLPEPRSSHDAAILNDTLYVGGGWMLRGKDGEGDATDGSNGARWHQTLLSLDLHAPEKGWKSQAQPFERRALAAVAYSGRVWFLGGLDSHDELSRGADWFDPASGHWGKGPDLPKGTMAGFGIAACVEGGRLFISPFSGKVYALSADETQWELTTTLNPARFFHHLLPLGDGHLVAIGGSNDKGHVKELEIVSVGSAVGSDTSDGSDSSSRATGWPQWRGPGRDGISAETGWLNNSQNDWPAEGPPLLWRAQVGVGMSSCAVAEGRVFAQGNDGNGSDSVFAFDAATGAALWKYTYPCASAAHEMSIVPNGPGATPTVTGGHVFTLSREGDLLCLEAANGHVLWQKNLVADLGGKRPVYGYTQSPLIDHGSVFLDVGSEPEKTGSTMALDAATGETRWRAGSGEAGYSSARVFERHGKRFVAMFKGEALDVFDPADGRVLWSHRTTVQDYCNALTPVFVGTSVLVSNTGTDPARLLAWDLGETPNVREVWAQRQFAMLFNNAILHEGCLFGFNEKRQGRSEFTCLDSATGEIRWVSDAVPIGTFILAGKRWIFLTRAGEVVLAPAASAELKPIARFRALEGKGYATPALAGGRLYVRSNNGEVAAFDLRGRVPK